MRKLSITFNPFKYILLFICLGQLACKKTSIAESQISKLSFEFNGTNYVLPPAGTDGLANWSVTETGLHIYRPDIFNGIVHFPSPSCAYLDPTPGREMSSLPLGTCQIRNDYGRPIDWVTVYVYQSGLYNITYKNCYTKSGFDIFTQSNYSFSVCDADGTFDLTLVNSEGKTISITKGAFELYHFAR